MGNPNLKPILAKVLVVFISGILWYLSNGLNGNFWYLLWIAPIPVLILSFNSSAKTAFVISFVAYLIGRLSWFSYLVTVATLVPAIIFTIMLSLIFAFIVLLSRATVKKLPSWISVFAFPVYFTAFEFLLFLFSPDGTAASIAYSQSDVLAVIQIASITGILGITFLITLFPSVIALCWMNFKSRTNLILISSFSGILIFSVLVFGIIRVSSTEKSRSVKVGLVVLDESNHTISKNFDPHKEKETVNLYSEEISNLAEQGAEIVILPERAFNMNKALQQEFTGKLTTVAKNGNLLLIAGYTNYTGENDRNSALVIDRHGNVLANYDKNHLVTGLERQFKPGKEASVFLSDQFKLGTAICKDLDFPDFIRDYGKAGVNLVCVPAWDFVVDAWLHSRMAVLRGVENGFSEIRAARQGFLTISDCYGRVTYEADCSKGKKASLIGAIKTTKKDTVFAKYGNWFGYLNFFVALLLIVFTIIRKKVH